MGGTYDTFLESHLLHGRILHLIGDACLVPCPSFASPAKFRNAQTDSHLKRRLSQIPYSSAAHSSGPAVLRAISVLVASTAPRTATLFVPPPSNPACSNMDPRTNMDGLGYDMNSFTAQQPP